MALIIDGKTPLDRSFDMIREARAAKRAEKKAEKGVEATAVVIEQPTLDIPGVDEPEMPF